MREAIRSELRTLLQIRIAALLAFLVGGLCAFAVFTYGLFKAVTSLVSNNASASGFLPMLLGLGLLSVVATLIVRVGERLEARCWALIADAGASVGDGRGDQLLAKQADGEDNTFADVRVRQSRNLSKRLRALIEQAWPDLR